MPKLPLCHCGQPIHYGDAWTEEMMLRNVKVVGEYVPITVAGVTYKVQRHYIALHGIKAWELHKLGFKVISNTNEGGADPWIKQPWENTPRTSSG